MLEEIPPIALTFDDVTLRARTLQGPSPERGHDIPSDQ